MWAVVNDKILDGGKNFVNNLHSNISDDSWVFYYVSKAIFDQLSMTQFTYERMSSKKGENLAED